MMHRDIENMEKRLRRSIDCLKVDIVCFYEDTEGYISASQLRTISNNLASMLDEVARLNSDLAFPRFLAARKIPEELSTRV